MMFSNRILSLIILFLFTSLAVGSPGQAYAGNDPCCPEDNNIRPARGSQRIAPLKSIPQRDVSPVRSIAQPDAVIVPGLAAGGFPNVADMIVGRVPGVMVSGGGFNNYVIRIRGAMGPPLLVIDEMPFYQANTDQSFNYLLQTIPTPEVASIEIIKNAAQAAIYGGHAGNGVIRINTKAYLHTEGE